MVDATAGDEPDGDEEPGERAETSHLADLEDGCGCAEVWEYLSDRREAGAE